MADGTIPYLGPLPLPIAIHHHYCGTTALLFTRQATHQSTTIPISLSTVDYRSSSRFDPGHLLGMAYRNGGRLGLMSLPIDVAKAPDLPECL